VFDEAHNIDDVCIEAYTVKVNRGLVEGAERNISDLRSRLTAIEGKHAAKFTEEYMNLLRTLAGRSFNQ
jgi:DNA excision repair protein ERCC-2